MFRLLVLVVTLAACLAEEEPQASANPSPILVHDDHVPRMEAHRLKESLARLRSDLHGVVDHRHSQDHQHYRDDRHRDRHHDHQQRDRHHDQQHRDRHHDHHSRDHQYRDHHDRGHSQRDHNDGHWWEHRIDQFEHDEPEGPVILRSIRPDGHHKPDIARQNKIIADVYSPDYAEPTWVLDYRYLKTGGRDYTRGPGGQIIILPKGIHTTEHKEFKNYDELIEHLRLKNLAERKKPQYFMPLGEGAVHEERRGYNDHRGYEDGDMWKHQG